MRKERIEYVLTGTLVLCALAVTAMVARREFSRPPDAHAPRPPTLVKDWKSYIAGDERIGPEAAPVVIVEFSDFQCPFCRRFSRVFDSLRIKYPTEVTLAHRNYPLTQIHPFARPAAIAAECAAAQGKFAEYAGRLFELQDSIASANWAVTAAQAGVLDVPAFELCLASQAPVDRLRIDSLAVLALGINATPAVIANGWLFNGTPTFGAVDSLIIRELKKQH